MNKSQKNEILESVQEILNDTFKESEKRNALVYEDRVNFACPYCGDSANARKKRGNIYFNGLNFHCYNCGKHTSYRSFVSDFDKEISQDMADLIATEGTYKKKEGNYTFDLEIFGKLEKLALTRTQMRKAFRLIEIPLEGGIRDYINSRCLSTKVEHFMYNSYRNELYVLNLTKTGRIVGFQIRSFNPDFVKYRSYNISKIYERLGERIDESEDDINLMNQVSLTYNLMTIDLFKPMYVFEGGIDSFFIPNSIGLCGVGRHFDLVEELPNSMYFFDNDVAGYKRTIEKLKLGKSVFLWKKFLDENGFSGKIKDFNDLIVYLVTNRIKFSFKNINEYFSNNTLDVLSI